MTTIAISDCHVGGGCESERLLSFLNHIHKNEVNKLIIVGDLLEGVNVRLKKKHWAILSKLRKMSDDMEIVWILGNHCVGTEQIANILGIQQVNYYILDKIMFVHGDMFDAFLTDHPIITNIADWLYIMLQKIDKSQTLARFAKLNSKQFMHNSKMVREGAIKFGSVHKCNITVSGHTHHAEVYFPKLEEKPIYYNTGCWTDMLCSYLVIEDDTIELKYWSGND